MPTSPPWFHAGQVYPVDRMLEGEQKKLLGMESSLATRVIGQEKAITAVSNAVRRAPRRTAGPQPTDRFIPVSRPTGVGKTELTKASGRLSVR